jgi:hypothetical protein
MELLRAYTKIHTFLTEHGLKHVLQKLDNKASGKLQTFIRQNDVSFQLVTSRQHQRNAAERAIATWKDHFVATLATTDPSFPLHFWYHLIDQASTTLILLRQSRINPRLSAKVHLNGAFDYNKTPFAPPGTRVVVHERPETRQTWDSHDVDGWYLGRAPKHYRCRRVYVSKTAAKRIADTVKTFPYQCEMLKTSSADAARHTAIALTHALQNPTPATPFAPIGDDQMRAIYQLAKTFATATNHNGPNAPTSPSTPTAKLTTAKCVLNSTISTPNARFMVADIKYFYLNTPLEPYKYMRLPLAMIPDKIIQQYQLRQLATPNGWVYIEIRKER